jgi:hypothetical protein
LEPIVPCAYPIAFHIAAVQGRDISIDRRITFAFWDVNVGAGWVFYFVSSMGRYVQAFCANP